MTVEELKRNLEYTKRKHEDDRVDTFGTNISAMCQDTLSVIEEMENDLEKSKNDFVSLLTAIKDNYPKDRSVYIELDVFMGEVIKQFVR